jgi:hypothetical protein
MITTIPEDISDVVREMYGLLWKEFLMLEESAHCLHKLLLEIFNFVLTSVLPERRRRRYLDAAI